MNDSSDFENEYPFDEKSEFLEDETSMEKSSGISILSLKQKKTFSTRLIYTIIVIFLIGSIFVYILIRFLLIKNN